MGSFEVDESSSRLNSLVSLKSQEEQHPVIRSLLTETHNIISILENNIISEHGQASRSVNSPETQQAEDGANRQDVISKIQIIGNFYGTDNLLI